MDKDDQKYRAPALEKGLDVLELLAAQRTPLSLSQISAALDRSVSELFRMVQVLEFRGYVAPAPTGDGLVLTNKLFALGMTRVPMKDLLEASLPVMRKLAEEVGQSCHLVVPSQEYIVVIARVEAPGDQGFSVRIGYRRPLIETASGLLLYAFAAEPQRAAWRDYFRRTAGRARWQEFESRAEKAKSDGYVQADSRVTRHILDLSAPILAQQVLATLTCPYLETPAAIPIADTIAKVRLAARAISASLELG